MKKKFELKHFANKKIVAMGILMVVVLMLSITIPKTSLEDRIIAVGMGIDFEGGLYSVAVQIINPSNSVGGGGGDGYAVLSAEGETITEAMNKITQKAGKTLSIAQCNLLILGQGILASEILPSVNYLVISWQLPEQAAVAGYDGKACEVLRVRIPVASLSALYLQGALLTDNKMDTMVKVTVVSFLAGLLSESGTAVIPRLEMHKIPADSVGSGDNTLAPEEEFDDFVFNTGFVITEDMPAHSIDDKDVVSYNLVHEKVKKGSITVEHMGANVNLELQSKKTKRKVEMVNGKPVVKITVEITMTVWEVNPFGEYESMESYDEVIMGEWSELARQQTLTGIVDTFEKFKAMDCDIFGFKSLIYSYAPDYYRKNLTNKDMSNVNADFEVKLKVKEA